MPQLACRAQLILSQTASASTAFHLSQRPAYPSVRRRRVMNPHGTASASRPQPTSSSTSSATSESIANHRASVFLAQDPPECRRRALSDKEGFIVSYRSAVLRAGCPAIELPRHAADHRSPPPQSRPVAALRSERRQTLAPCSPLRG